MKAPLDWTRITFTDHMVEAAAVIAQCQAAFDFEGSEQVTYEVKVFRTLKGASSEPFFAVGTNLGDPTAFCPIGEGDTPFPSTSRSAGHLPMSCFCVAG